MTRKRVLVINPNTNSAVTDRVRRAAMLCASPGIALEVVNPEFGPLAIETAEDRAAAVPFVLDLIGRKGGGYDGCILACFDDIAIAEARRILSVPVISMAEAGIKAAAARYIRFDVVTTVQAAVPTISALVVQYGLEDRCVVRATRIGVTETAAMTERAEAALSIAIDECRQAGSDAVVLGSGAYTGRRQDLARAFSMPFIDGLEAALTHCEHHRPSSAAAT